MGKISPGLVEWIGLDHWLNSMSEKLIEMPPKFSTLVTWKIKVPLTDMGNVKSIYKISYLILA